MKKHFIVLLFAFMAIQARAQVVYTLYPSTTTYAPISGTTPFLTGNGTDPIADEGYANNVPLGFTFNYNGVNYSEVAISTNGFLSFQSLVGSEVLNNLTSGAIGERPIVAPLWDDINLQTTSNLKYTTTGSSPNQVFTVEWLNARWGFGASAACVSFQVRLYQSTNYIEFVYRQESGTPNLPSASIGITANSTGSNNFISLQDVSASPSVSKTTEAAAISVKPATGQVYQLRPGAATPVNIASFIATKQNGVILLNWQTLTESNDLGFEVQRSINGIDFSALSFVGTKAINGSSTDKLSYQFMDASPFITTTYYRLKQMDKDGKAVFSNIVSVKANEVSDVQLTAVYPNPATSLINAMILSSKQQDVVIVLTDATGRTIIQQQVKVNKGELDVPINISSLIKGAYYLKTISDNGHDVRVKQIIKQ